jgi:hypothetical protein
MFKRMLNLSAQTNLEVGRRILPKLRADARLAEPATALQAAFDEMEAAINAATAAEKAVRDSEAIRDDTGRKFGTVLREFGMVILNAGGNHHNVQPYVIYFPDGYGDVRSCKPRELIQFAGQATAMLEKETDPKLVSYRQVILDACAGFVSAQEVCEAAVRTRTDALAFQKVARRRFVRALGQARNLVAVSCDEEPGYVKAIFAPARVQRSSAPATPDKVETPGTPDEAQSPKTPEASPIPELTPVPAMSKERAA